ncbi:hypothetical protein PHJA_002323300 [Phtheirospermum japonicum]|uniref:S-protein homolog n=1 Tax=Phtheirospermum japonicum TaxID=374723 RepID=A0A830D0X8_9LAMI|nr:hypothetical protein PHJA_002323300 [Phtheirospermum japonicum]
MSSSSRKCLFVLFSIYLLVVIKVRSSPIVFKNEHEVRDVNSFPIKVRPGNKFHVYIINSFPKNSPTMSVHCVSKDDDLGDKSLNPGESFTWSFKLNLWQTTLFHCSFGVSSKLKTSHDVFNGEIGPHCETSRARDGNNCVWSVKEDGFYISNRFPPVNSTKMYDW